MASYRRSPIEDEVQETLGRVTPAPPAPLGGFAKAQTLARSSGNPDAQQAGQQMLEQQQRAEQIEARQQAHENERRQREQQRDAEKTQREAEQAAEQARARDVRERAAAGQQTETDIATGKRTIATHPDGAPKYVPGPQGPVQPVATQGLARKQAGGGLAPLPDQSVMLGGDGAAATAGEPERRTIFAQPVRDDRGNVYPVPPETKTDKTGFQYVSERNPVTGQTDKRAVGVDEAARQRATATARIEQQQAEHSLHANNWQQANTMFQPRWQPVEKEYKDAQREWEKLADSGIRQEGSVWVKVSPETGSKTILTPEAVITHQRNAEDAKARLARAKAAYDPLAPQAENLSRREQELKMQRLQLAEQKTRIAYGLAEDDDTLASLLARQDQAELGDPEAVPDFSSAVDPSVAPVPTADRDVAVIQGAAAASVPAPGVEPTNPTGQQPQAPNLLDAVASTVIAKTPEAAKQFAQSALSGLAIAPSVTVAPREEGESSNRFQLLTGGAVFGFVHADPSGAWLEVSNEARDIDKVALGTKQGIPVYIGGGTRDKRTPDMAASWVKQVMGELAPPVNPDGTPGEAPTQGQMQEKLKALGADYPSLLHAAAVGDLPIQLAESMAQTLYGTSIKPTDPEDANQFGKWLQTTGAKENADHVAQFNTPASETVASRWAAGKSNIAERNQIRRQYLGEWYAENRGKPGVTRAKVQQLMAQDLGNQEDTGTKALSATKAAGRILRDDVAGSMAGLLMGAAKDFSAAEVALFGNEDAAKTLAEGMRLRNRDSANWSNAAKRNIIAWNTDEGRKAKMGLQHAMRSFQTTIDEEYQKPTPDKAAVSAAEKQVRVAALAMHNLNPDTSWPVTEDTLDPDKDSALRSALARYIVTADPAEMALYKERLLMNNGRRQFSAEMEQKTRGMGKFGGSVVGGMYAGWQEVGSELVGDALTLATVGGSKAVQLTLNAVGHAGTASRIARMLGKAKAGMEALESVGRVEGTLAKPLTRGQRARNAVVGAARTGIISGAEEGFEEALVEPGSDNPDLVSSFALGAFGGIGLAPAFHAGGKAIGVVNDRMEANRLATENGRFAKNWNVMMADTPGFKPITPEQASVARSFVSSEQFQTTAEVHAAAAADFENAHAELAGQAESVDPAAETKLANIRAELSRVREAMAKEGLSEERMAMLAPHEQRLAEAEAAQVASMPDPAASDAALNRVMQARQQLEAAQSDFSAQTVGAVDAINEIEEVGDPARQTFYRGIAKVAAGNESLLTANERQAIAGAQTRNGAAMFADVEILDASGNSVLMSVLTDEARAELQQDMPALGRLVRTTESDLILEQQTAQAAGQAPAVPVVSEAAPAAAPVTAPAVNPTAESAAPNPAEMDAVEYQTLLAENRSLPPLDAVVTEAYSAGRPVSVSMARASSVLPPANTVQRGGFIVPNGGPVATPAGPPAVPSAPAARSTALQVAEEVKRRVEAALPALRGRIQIVEQSKGSPSGGVIADSASNSIHIVLPDVEREVASNGEAAVADVIERFAARHEVVHLVQFESVRALWVEQGKPGEFGQFFDQWYGKIAKELPPESFAVARKIYGADAWDLIATDADRAAEFVRMLVEAKLDPEKADQFGELFRDIRFGRSPSLVETLRAAVKVIVDMITKGTLPESVREHVDQLTDLYRQIEGQNGGKESGQNEGQVTASPEASSVSAPLEVDTSPDTSPEEVAVPSEPSAEAPAVSENNAPVAPRIEPGPDGTARIVRGDEVHWEGTASEAEEVLYTPLRVTGDARGAAANNSALTPKLKRSLDFATEGLADYLATLPPAERRATVDAAINEWLEAREKPRTQRTIDAPARTRAYHALNSGEYPTLHKLFQAGKIAPRPNVISLILSKKRSGGKLTTGEISLLDNNPEYDGAVFQNQFEAGGTGKVAREVISLLMAKQGEGTRPDVAASYIEDGLTASDMWQRVYKELQQIAGGTQQQGVELDPNRDWTAVEIEENERRAAPVEDQASTQAREFQEANAPGNGEAFAVADFTPEMEGSTVTVDGEPMTVTSVEMDSLGAEAETVVLNDHLRFGRQVLEGGEVVYIEAADEPVLAASPTSTPQLGEKVEAAAAVTDIAPTEAQAEAGNYRKGKVSLQGMRISIENPRASTRSGTDGKGKAWSVEMAHHYGYILGTEARDGDHVDAFIGPNPESSRVYIVNQINPESRRFDEHKVMLGFDSRREAIEGYKASYSPGWKGLGDLVETDVTTFRNWLENGDTKKAARAADLKLFEMPSASTANGATSAAAEPVLASPPSTPEGRADLREFLEGPPVATLTGTEFQSDGVPLTTKVPAFYEKVGKTSVDVPGIGPIALDERFVRASLAHGMGRAKASAFAAVPDVLEKGRLIHSAPLSSSADMVGHFFAAPISLGGEHHVAVVLVRTDTNTRRAYVHEVVLTKALQTSLKTEALTTSKGAQNGDAGAIRKLLYEIFEVNPPQAGPSLSASPTPEAASAVDQALEKMPPIYRQVFEAVNAGATPAEVMKRFSITENAVKNILNAVRARLATATAAAGDAGLTPAMRDGKIDGGRPDLALSTIPAVAAVDQVRNESGVPDVRGWDEVVADADRMLANNYQGTYDSLLNVARDQKQMSDVEVAATKAIIARETMAGKIQSAADRVKLGMLIHGYREIGTETARSLAIRRDPHVKPAERHAQILAEALFTPDAETRKRMREAPKGEVENILAGWMARVDAIKADLQAQGLDIEKSLAAFNEREAARKATEKDSPRATAAIDAAFKKRTIREKRVIEAIRSGALASKVAFLTGLNVEEIKPIWVSFVADYRQNMRDSAKRFMAGVLASSPSSILAELEAEFGIYDWDAIDDTKPGFVDRRNEKPRKEKKAKPAPAPAPERDYTAMREEWAKRPFDTWRGLYQKEMDEFHSQGTKPTYEEWVAREFPATEAAYQAEMDLPAQDRSGQSDAERLSREEWAAQKLSTWKTLWQTEMEALQPGARVSFDEWREQPVSKETAAAGADMFPEPVQPINEATGTFDLNDPLAMKAVIDAFAAARGSAMDALMEYWRMSVLSGPQTHVVNTSSNLLHSAYNLLPRRAVEASVNTALSVVGLGSQESATFGEFGVMASHLRIAASLAARNAIRSWKLEARVFESYATAEALQLDFTGVGGERFEPAVRGKFGKLMRSISFRPMTAADEFMKAFYTQLEASAQAHRMAKAEKLSGADYEARMKELLVPGSAAWIRAFDESKRVTFQEDLNGENPRAIHRIDQVAELAKKARSLPWLGRPLTFFLPFIDTPTNIAKQAIEMSPLGLFLSLYDGARSIAQRFFRGKLTKAEADAAAAQLYDRARLVQDVTNQTLAFAAYWALSGLTKGDGDDDNGLPVITGTQPYKSTRRGERDNAYAVIPPQSIRIGDKVFSYARIDPFATAFASMVDMHVEIHRAGGFNASVASQWISRFKDQAKDKTFLVGISNLMNAIEDPDRFAERISASTVTGFVPNLIRQPIREADTYVRETGPRKGDGFFRSIGKAVGYSLRPEWAPVKMDVWGNPVLAHRGDKIGGTAPADLAFHIFDPTNLTSGAPIDPIDRWIYRWNLNAADSADRIAIQPLRDSFSFTLPGQKDKTQVTLTSSEQADANRRAGQSARAMLGNGWEKAPLDEARADLIRSVVRQAQTIERANLKMQKLGSLVGGSASDE